MLKLILLPLEKLLKVETLELLMFVVVVLLLVMLIKNRKGGNKK